MAYRSAQLLSIIWVVPIFLPPAPSSSPDLVSHLRGALGNYMGLFEFNPSIWGQSSAAQWGQPSRAAWTAGFGVEENSAASHLREVLRVAGRIL